MVVVGKWLHAGAPGFTVVMWMGNHAGCEPAGIGVMGSGGQQRWEDNWFGGEVSPGMFSAYLKELFGII